MMEFFHEFPFFFSYPLQISFLRSSFSSCALRFVVVRLLPFLDAVDDALLVFPGQELHMNRQYGDAPFFGLAQLDFLPAVGDEEDVLVGEEDEAALFVNLLVAEFPEGHELTAHDEALVGDEADDVALAVDAPQAEQQNGDVIQARRQRRFAEHEPEKIHADQGEDELHKYGKPFGVFKFFFDDAAVWIAAHHVLSRNHSPSCWAAS